MEWLVANWKELGTAALGIFGAFSIIAKITPTKADDKVVDFILRIIHFFGLTKVATKQ